jgi:hypothetical protein
MLERKENRRGERTLTGECVDMVHGLHGARFSNSTKIDILKFRKNSEKNP